MLGHGNGNGHGGLRSMARTTCACQPAHWEFTLDFSRTSCDETDLLATLPSLSMLRQPSPSSLKEQQQQPQQQQPKAKMKRQNWNSAMAMTSVVCTSSLRPAPKERDQPPEEQRHFFDHVERIHIREMGIDESDKNWLDRIVSKNDDSSYSLTLRGQYHDGDSFSYTSVVVQNNKDDAVPRQYPTGLQVHLIGKNQANQPAEFDFTLYFHNDCDIYPIVSAGQYMGPVTVTQVSAPPHEVCPLVDSLN